MLTATLRFASLLLTGLLVGTMFGIWLGFNPVALSASAFIEMQQNSIRALNVSMPILGLTCIVLTGALAFCMRRDARNFVLLSGATLGLIVAGLITRFANQPINAVVMSLSAHAPPANWTELRKSWWHWHVVRTAIAIAAFALSVLAATLHRSLVDSSIAPKDSL